MNVFKKPWWTGMFEDLSKRLKVLPDLRYSERHEGHKNKKLLLCFFR